MIEQQTVGVHTNADAPERIHVCVGDERTDRAVLVEALQEGPYAVTTARDEVNLRDADLLICDVPALRDHRDALAARRAASLYAPVLLLLEPDRPGNLPAEGWADADDVICTPLVRSELHMRVRNLLVMRTHSMAARRRSDVLQHQRSLLSQAQRLAGAWAVNLRRDTLHWTDEVYRIHDLPVGGEITTDEAIAFYAPEARLVIQDALQCCIEEHAPYDLELPLITATGRRRWVRTVGAVTETDGEQVVEIAGAIQDITERKEAEQELHATKQRLEKTLESIDEGVLVVDPEERHVVACNAAVERIFGYDRDELVGACTEVLHVDRAAYERFGEVSEASLDASGRFEAEYEMRHKDGRIIVTEHRITPLQGEDWSHGVVSVVRDVTVRKAREEALQRHHDLLEQTQKLAGAWEVDLATETVAWSEEVYRIHEVEPGTEIDLEAGIHFYAPEARPVIRAAVERAIEWGTPWDLELPLITATGRRRWVRAVGEALEHEGEVVKLAGAFQDITDQVDAEAQIRLQAEALSAAANAIAITDQEGAITWVNPAFTTLTGYTEDEAVGQTMALLQPGDQASHDAMWDTITSGTVWHGERVNQRKDGSRYVEEQTITPVRDGEGTVHHYIAIKRDITERKEAEARRARMSAIVESSQNAIVGGTLDGTIHTWNAAAEALYGYTAEEAMGAPIAMLVPPERENEFEDEIMERLRAGESVGPVETVRLRKDGTRFDALLSVTPIRGADGAVEGVAGTVLDITERNQQREALIEAKEKAEEMSRLKSAFLANMSHEIRTPLTSIIGFAEILQQELDGEALEFVELIHESSQRLQGLLTSVLDLARIESESIRLHYERIDVVQKAERIVAMFEDRAQRKGLALRFHPPDEALVVKTDPDAFERMVMNLVANAIKFTPEGSVAVHLTASADQVMVRVEDTGVGIHGSHLETIFDEFKQESEGFGRSFEGSGLGLTITKRLAELMGGTITVDSTKGEGSTFTLILSRT